MSPAEGEHQDPGTVFGKEAHRFSYQALGNRCRTNFDGVGSDGYLNDWIRF